MYNNIDSRIELIRLWIGFGKLAKSVNSFTCIYENYKKAVNNGASVDSLYTINQTYRANQSENAMRFKEVIDLLKHVIAKYTSQPLGEWCMFVEALLKSLRFETLSGQEMAMWADIFKKRIGEVVYALTQEEADQLLRDRFSEPGKKLSSS